MLLALGSFIFSVDTAAYQTMTLNASYPWASAERFANTPGLQATGKEHRTVSLSGTVYPSYKGAGSLAALRTLAAGMVPLPMVSGSGRYLGLWAVKSINEDSELFFEDGVPQKQSFSMELERYGTEYVGYNSRS